MTLHVGLIGGIGPAATVEYYTGLVDRFRAAGAELPLTIVQADIETLIGNSLADRRQAQAEVYAGLIGRLAAAGADFAAITSLGGHFCFAESKAISPLPLLSAITPLDDFFVASGIGTIGLLGTETVMRTRAYGQITRTRAVAPAGDLVALGDIYLDVARTGTCSPAQRQTFFDAGREMIEQQGADAVLLGGTDLGLVFAGQDPGFPVIDALEIHLDAIFGAATGGQLPDSR